MSNTVQRNFEVDRQQWQNTRVVEQPLDTTLNDNEILLKVDRFALTANNISYCAAGVSLGYWQFFPAEGDWGRIPAMGYGEVAASNCPDIEVGERVWGFFPMASHLKIQAGNISPSSFSDVSAHRKGLSPIYANFDRAKANPLYDPSRENLEMLLRGLFMTSWLVEDFMFDNDHHGAMQYLITSASSKTSIALAYAVRERGLCKSIGITSEGNRAFVEGLGCYDTVISYDEIDQLDASVGSMLVDMAGSTQIRARLHQHFGEQLRYSCLIGATHFDEAEPDSADLPGAVPTFFFAPSQMEKRMKEWGPAKLFEKLGTSLLGFMEFSKGTLTIIEQTGASAIEATYQQVLGGTAPPSEAYILSMWEQG